MRAAVYTRISADHDGDGLGVERQREDCQQLAESLGWDVVEIYTDNDISAYGGKTRPAYRKLLDDIVTGHIEAVLTWHPDRLHRHPAELEGFIDLVEKHQTAIQTVKAGHFDLSTSSGKMVARMLGAVARAEVDSARDRMIRAHQQAAVNGKWRARRRVFGWVVGGTEVVPEEAEAIRTAAQDILAGVSLGAIARRWNAAGLQTTGTAPRFDASAVRRTVENPRCAAIQVYRGKEVGKGEWPAILTEDEHRALVALFSNPTRTRSVSYERRHQGSGIYRCGRCGAKMAIHHAVGGWRAYKCSVSNHLTRQAVLLDEFISKLVIARLSRDDAALILEPTAGVDVPALQLERDGLTARLTQLTTMFTEAVIDANQLREGTAALRTKIEAIDAKLAAARSSSALADLVLSGDDLSEVWAGLGADVRGKTIEELMTVTVLPSPNGRRRFMPEYVDIAWKV